MPLDEVIKARLAERERVVDEVRAYALRLRERLSRLTAILYGSYARGDFNLWSDVDVVMISEHFRGRDFVTRCVKLNDAPPRLEPICWTPEEAAKALRKPWWREALRHRVVIVDDYGVA
ncbi:nucleotidyltransferase domain-containing protein, partial [Caldivirga sp. MU80]|uniref:nucleotidyltransferase domain-containing protein n=1 Tax=Caldivirga sp. MU80 TaxID=1650354 RepID=UPI001EE44C2F